MYLWVCRGESALSFLVGALRFGADKCLLTGTYQVVAQPVVMAPAQIHFGESVMLRTLFATVVSLLSLDAILTLDNHAANVFARRSQPTAHASFAVIRS
jgi:hypothetical protein